MLLDACVCVRDVISESDLTSIVLFCDTQPCAVMWSVCTLRFTSIKLPNLRNETSSSLFSFTVIIIHYVYDDQWASAACS